MPDSRAPDYPFIVWTFGDNGSGGFLVRFPDLPASIEGHGATLDEARGAANKAAADWIAKQIAFAPFVIALAFLWPAVRVRWTRIPRPGDHAEGICPTWQREKTKAQLVEALQARYFQRARQMVRAIKLEARAIAPYLDRNTTPSTRGRRRAGSDRPQGWATSTAELVKRIDNLSTRTLDAWRQDPDYRQAVLLTAIESGDAADARRRESLLIRKQRIPQRSAE